MIRSKIFISFFIAICSVYLADAQIVTSKKEAIKRGIYKKPIEVKKIVADKIIEKTKITTETKIIPAKIAPKKTIINTEEDNDLILTPQQNYLASQLINNAMEFIGIRYQTGGTSLSGMDCSGMITAVFNIFDIKLPRTSMAMSKVGEQVNTENAKKGDLIFFRTHGGVINHVGMVIDVINDEVKFIHSSVSKGVIVSSTNESYYKRAFAQINKVLEE